MQNSVFSGVRLHPGEPVAVKAMSCRDKKMRARVRSELHMANIFRDHDGASGVLGLLDFWCPHGSPPCCCVDVPDDDNFQDDAPDHKITTSEAIEYATLEYEVAAHQASREETSEDEVSEGETPECETSGNEARGNGNTRSEVAEDEEFQAHQPPRNGHVDHASEADHDDQHEGEGESLPDPCCPIVYYSMPLAEHSFADMPWATVNYQDRLRFFRQTLMGLRTLHKRGIIHSRISPKALALQLDEARENAHTIDADTQPSLRAAIRDLVHARLGSDPFSRARGAESLAEEPWIAPGSWGYPACASHIGPMADMWSLGVSWFHTFAPLPQGKITPESYDTLARNVEDQVPAPLRALIQQMIAWDPTERPGVEEALAHESWAPLLDEKKRERNARITDVKRGAAGSGSDVKRVRLLSPEEGDIHTYDPQADLLASHSE